jgi:hypothetical protein
MNGTRALHVKRPTEHSVAEFAKAFPNISFDWSDHQCLKGGYGILGINESAR